jgi:predicted O-methyltransferase YrrM
VAELYETKALQNEAEIAAFVEIVKRENVRSYLEIGSKFGGSLWRVGSALPSGSKVVAIDMPAGTRAWNESKVSLQACSSRLRAMGHETTLFWGDSTDSKIVAAVRELGPFDLVLIDANHTLPYVAKDWENYGQLGRIVAFHDIAWRRSAGWTGYQIDVREFWDSIKGLYPHREEIVLDPTGQDNGFGVLWR